MVKITFYDFKHVCFLLRKKMKDFFFSPSNIISTSFQRIFDIFHYEAKKYCPYVKVGDRAEYKVKELVWEEGVDRNILLQSLKDKA